MSFLDACRCQAAVSGVKVYGCSSGDDREIRFAPRDVLPWQHDVKDNCHGIGYRGRRLGTGGARQLSLCCSHGGNWRLEGGRV